MKYSRIREVKPPRRGTARSAGIDIFLPEFTEDFMEDLKELNPGIREFIGDESYYQGLIVENSIQVFPHCKIRIPTGIRVEVPFGYVLWVANKTSKSWSPTFDKLGEIVDDDYQGEIFFSLQNYGKAPAVLRPGDAIAQLICVPVKIERMEEVLDEALHPVLTERGQGAFGSTDEQQRPPDGEAH